MRMTGALLLASGLIMAVAANGFGPPEQPAMALTVGNAEVAAEETPAASPSTGGQPDSDKASEERESFLRCVRHRESRGNYAAFNRSSGAAGAYQFMPATAKATAAHAGRSDLAAVPVLAWSPQDQDAMAHVLYDWQGRAPWGWYCRTSSSR